MREREGERERCGRERGRGTWKSEISRLTARDKGRKGSVGLAGGVGYVADKRGLRKEQLALGPQRVTRAQEKRLKQGNVCVIKALGEQEERQQGSCR